MDHLFCEICENMYEIKIEPTDNDKTKLVYKCKNCDISINKSDKNECVFYQNYNYDNIKRQNVINNYTVYDNTLPKALGVRCPNNDCPSKKPDIRYIKYDNDNMRYVYMCIDCHNNGNKTYVW